MAESEQADPGANAASARDYLANERTLLAWARTSIALIAAGATLTGLGTLHYVRTGRALERGQYRWSPIAGASASVALVVVALGLMLYLLL